MVLYQLCFKVISNFGRQYFIKDSFETETYISFKEFKQDSFLFELYHAEQYTSRLTMV